MWSDEGYVEEEDSSSTDGKWALRASTARRMAPFNMQFKMALCQTSSGYLDSPLRLWID